jgi:agmatine deiminase
MSKLTEECRNDIKKKVTAEPPTSAAIAGTTGWRMPAEWAPHAATWLAFPHKRGDWPGKADAVEWVFAEMARHLTRCERVRILVRNAKEAARAQYLFGAVGCDLNQVDCVKHDTDRSWTRDYLPSFVLPVARGKRRRARELGAVKWRFTGWNRYPDHKLDDAAGEYVAREFADAALLPEVRVRGQLRRVVLEGGSIDVDGEGTVLTTEECLLVGRRARHKAIGRVASEQVLKEQLGATQVIWLPDGIAGDDTSGHIDDFARFVAPGVVALCAEPRRSDPNHRTLAIAKERLAAARDARGQRLQIVPLPMPEPVMHGKLRLPASYANFYIATDCVLVPTFNDANDRKALGILAELFPQRRVIGIHASELVLGLGTLHCSTQQEPLF